MLRLIAAVGGETRVLLFSSNAFHKEQHATSVIGQEGVKQKQRYRTVYIDMEEDFRAVILMIEVDFAASWRQWAPWVSKREEMVNSRCLCTSHSR